MNHPAQNEQVQRLEAVKGWQSPTLKVLYIAGGTQNTPLCGTVDSPCTRMSADFGESCPPSC